MTHRSFNSWPPPELADADPIDVRRVAAATIVVCVFAAALTYGWVRFLVWAAQRVAGL
jgi:hypothetical protein